MLAKRLRRPSERSIHAFFLSPWFIFWVWSFFMTNISLNVLNSKDATLVKNKTKNPTKLSITEISSVHRWESVRFIYIYCGERGRGGRKKKRKKRDTWVKDPPCLSLLHMTVLHVTFSFTTNEAWWTCQRCGLDNITPNTDKIWVEFHSLTWPLLVGLHRS